MLDLVFTNDNEVLLSQELIESVILTDHSLCVIETNITTDFKNHKKTVKNYTTDIPLYNLLKADDKEWESLNEQFLSVNWDEDVLNKEMDDLTDTFIKVLEDKVKISMKNKSLEKTTHDKNGNIFASRNLIPSNVRKLFKKKCKLSKQLRAVTNLDRCITLRKNVELVDIQIQNAYEYRRNINEQKTFRSQKKINITYTNILKD